MSTRSLVGIKSESGLVARYVHSDGYPSAKLDDLNRIVDNLGIAEAAKVLMGADKGGWSYLAPARPEIDNYLGADRAEAVPGVGLKYLDAPDTKIVRFDPTAENDSWCEYAYFIDVEHGTVDWYVLGYLGKPVGPFLHTIGDEVPGDIDDEDSAARVVA